MKFEWEGCPLSNVVETIIDYRGKTPKKLGDDWSPNGIRALSAKNIKTGQLVQPDSIKYVNESLYKKWMKEEVNRGDILITSEAPFGELLYWDSDEKIVLSQRLFSIRCKKDFDSKYIYYHMQTNEFQHEMRGRATGTTVLGIRQPELLKCTIHYPTLNTQRAIASILTSLDNKIALNCEINHNLPLAA